MVLINKSVDGKGYACYMRQFNIKGGYGPIYWIFINLYKISVTELEESSYFLITLPWWLLRQKYRYAPFNRYQ